MTNREAIDILRKLEPPRTSKKHFDDFIQARDMAINSLSQPERIKGHWIKISPANIYECSECGKSVMTNDICAYDFCHGCGAEMEVTT